MKTVIIQRKMSPQHGFHQRNVFSCFVVFILGFACLFLCSPLFSADGKGRVGLVVSLRSFNEDISQAQRLGVSAIRVIVPWQDIAPKEVIDDQHRGESDAAGPADEQPGEFNWALLDHVVTTARQHRMDVVLTVRAVSSWGTKRIGLERSSSLPALMRHWTFFLSSLAKRYKGQGIYYQIENEVGNKLFWDGTQEEYGALLKASYEAVKYADEDARILTAAVDCGIARTIRTPAGQEAFRRNLDSWWRAILSTKAFDIVSVSDYYYPDSGDEVNGFTFAGYLAHVLKLIKETGSEPPPVWITSVGYVGAPAEIGGRTDNGSPEKQAQWLREACSQAFKLGAERLFWASLNDQGLTYFGAMGLNDMEGNPRPSWNSFKSVAVRKD